MPFDYDCLGFGICAADYLCIVPKYPRLDEKTEAVEFSYQGGGPVATALVALARLGFKTTFIGKVGNDAQGEFVLNQFADEGVDTTATIVDEHMSTNKAFIWIDKPSGKKSIVLNGENYRSVRPHEISLDHVASVKCVLIDGRDTEGTFQIMEWGKEKGASIVLDAGSPREKMDFILSSVDYPVVSEHFCHSYLRTEDYHHAVEMLLAYGAKAAVVTCGEKGCFGGDKTGFYFQKAFEVPLVDTTGAGDVFHGAFIAGLLHHWSMPKILRFASAVAAIKCTQIGGRKGIPNLEQVNRFLQSN